MTPANPSPRPPLSPHVRGVLLMVASTVFFTANVLLTRVLGQGQRVDVWLICCARFAIGLALIGVFYRRDVQPRHLFRNRKLAERGLVGSLGVYGFYLTVVHLGAGRATFINTTYVGIGALLAVWILGERFRIAVAAGSVVALAGLALLTNAFGTNAHASAYDLLAVVVAFGSAWVVITIRQLHATEHTSTIFAAQCVYGLLFCGIPAAWQWRPLTGGAWIMLLVASVAAGAGQLAMTRAFRDLPVAEGSLLQMLVPLGTGIGGMVFFGEHFTSLELAGAGLILAGTVGTALRR
ncbi:MAG TPA: DMT family transporter [Opitutaceae bacterium]|nr:DMT family transporter [Opitutaceae bacterium]